MNTMNRTTLIMAARVWTATGAECISDGAVLLRDGLIADVGPRRHFQNAADPVRIDLGDVTLLPGFVDAHLHLSGQEWDGRLLLAHGVTTVRDIGNRFPAIIRLRERQARGRWTGPRVVAWGPLLDADPPHWPHLARVIRAGEDVEAVVDELLDGGADGCKTYYRLPPALVERVVRQAHRRGKRVSCHAGATSVRTALELGMDCVEHTVTLAPEVLAPGQGWHQLDVDHRGVTELIQRFKNRGAWLDPTLGVMEGELFWWGPHFERTPGYDLLPPDLRAWMRNVQAAMKDAYHWDEARLAAAAEGFRRGQWLVRRFHEAGVPLLTGSDMPFVPPGLGVHYELQLLAGAGIPNEAVLRMATVNASTFLGLADRVGALAPGRIADLVAVDGNPLQDMKASQNIVAVWQGGRRLDCDALRREALGALESLDPGYDAAFPPFGIKGVKR